MLYQWMGEPIADIRKWCEDHNDELVRVKHTWTAPNAAMTEIDEHEEILELPRTWAGCMRFGGPSNDQYEIIGPA